MALVLAVAIGRLEPWRVERLGLSRAERRRAEQLAGECGGWLVFQRESERRPESICVARVGSGFSVQLSPGRYPRWSADGRQIAFFIGSTVCVMTAEGRWRRAVAVAQDPEPRALVFHPSGQEIWFTDGDRLCAAELREGRVRTVLTNVVVRGLAFSLDGRRLAVSVSGHRMYAFSVNDGVVVTPGRPLGRGCSAAVAPEGDLYTDLDGRHVCIRLRRWENDEVVRELPGPSGWPVDNESWSNRRRWLVARTEVPGPVDIWVYDTTSGAAVRLTATGDANRPHLWVAPSGAAHGWLRWWWRRWVGSGVAKP
ncbi:MAG: hypothetical protein N2652_08760 [Kiritimatiellae bacterium]|nr:hypothetical protein [Kiritimatiellia bacterium]